MKYSDYHLEEILDTTAIDYTNPLPKDYQSFHYKPIESCYDYSYGVLIHVHYKTPYVYATKFEGVITPILTKDNANKAYRTRLTEILDEIRSQQAEEYLPY